MFRKKNRKILKIILAIFLYLKKNSVEIQLIFKRKNRKKLKIIFLFLKKKSVNSPIKG